MPQKYDVLIRNARLRNGTEQLLTIAIANGVIASIGENSGFEADVVLDAHGNLVTESFINPHLHLCKVHTMQMMDEASLKDYHGAEMGKAMTAIELAARVKENYDERWIIRNVRRVVAEAALNGNTHIRAFADVDNKARLEGVKALLRAREEFNGIVDIQVVAFPQDGIVREPGAALLVDEAMKLGADVVGGIPWIEYTEADIDEHVKLMFDLAQKYDKPVSMLVDDAGDPGLRSLERLAVETIQRGWQGRTLGLHARAMALYPQPYLQKLIALLKQAQLGVVTDPHTGPLHLRVRELLDAGCLVCLGQDDISDAYYPFGHNSMLEVAFLAAHLLWFTTRGDMDALYDMITGKAAEAIGLSDYGLKAGSAAHLVVLDVPDVLEALRYHTAPVHVISHGKLVNEAMMLEVRTSGEMV